MSMSSPEGPRGSDTFDLSRSEVRRRSLAGVFYITSSGFANLLIGFVGTLALARMLTPDDFGVVAVGLTVTLLGAALADGGLGAGMIRRPQPPTRSELRTLNGIQLAIALAICLPVVFISLGFGLTGAVTAIMIASLPITTLQTPGRVVLAREMRFDRQALVDSGMQASFYAFSVTSVALGAGVWGLATGSVVRAIAGTLLQGCAQHRPPSPVPARLAGIRRTRSLRPPFPGELVRVRGPRADTQHRRSDSRGSELCSVSGRLPTDSFRYPRSPSSLSTPWGSPLWRIFSLAAKTSGRVIVRTVRRASIVATFVFPAFAAASPELIPALFGEQWRDAADVMPFICLSTLILGSISVAASSYLNASGRPGVVAWASAAFGVVWIVMTAPLLPVLGVAAIGVGNLCGALVEALILDRATRRTASVAPYRPLLRPLAVALVSGTAGWLVCVAGPPGLAIALAAAALTLALSVAGLLLVCSGDLKDTIRLAAGTIRQATRPLGRTSTGRA